MLALWCGSCFSIRDFFASSLLGRGESAFEGVICYWIQELAPVLASGSHRYGLMAVLIFLATAVSDIKDKTNFLIRTQAAAGQLSSGPSRYGVTVGVTNLTRRSDTDVLLSSSTQPRLTRQVASEPFATVIRKVSTVRAKVRRDARSVGKIHERRTPEPQTLSPSPKTPSTFQTHLFFFSEWQSPSRRRANALPSYTL